MKGARLNPTAKAFGVSHWAETIAPKYSEYLFRVNFYSHGDRAPPSKKPTAATERRHPDPKETANPFLSPLSAIADENAVSLEHLQFGEAGIG